MRSIVELVVRPICLVQIRWRPADGSIEVTRFRAILAVAIRDSGVVASPLLAAGRGTLPLSDQPAERQLQITGLSLRVL